MRLALFLFLCVAAARAGTVSLSWDANSAAEQVTGYTVYEQTSANVWTKVLDVTTPTVTLPSVAVGVRTYAVTARNAWGESARSNSVSTPPAPSAPTNLRVITITISP